jgi:nucleoside-diphosphate-sugar epimerase
VSGLAVTVFGATGFTGRYIVNKLGMKEGRRLWVVMGPCRTDWQQDCDTVSW